MAGGEPRLGATATYMRHNDHGTTRLSTEIDILHDRRDNEYRVFSAGSVRKWSKFGLVERSTGQGRAVPREIAVYHVGLVREHGTARNRHSEAIADDHGIAEVERPAVDADTRRAVDERARIVDHGSGASATAAGTEQESVAGIVLRPYLDQH